MKKLYAIILSFGLIIAPVHQAKAEMSWGGIPNMILGISIGVSGSSLLMLCTAGGVNPSIWAFMAGSLGYISAEMAGANAFQAHLKAQAVSIEDMQTKVKNGELQLASLQTQLNSTNLQLEYVKKRKGWMYAVGATFLIATILAIIESAREKFLGVPANALCTNTTSTKWWNKGVRVALAGAFMGTSVKSAGINTSSNDGGMTLGMLGAGVAGLSPLLMLLESVGNFMDNLMSKMVGTPEARIWTFGAASVLTAAIIVDLESTNKTLEQNALDIQKVIDEQFPTTTSEIQTPGGPDSVGGNTSALASTKSLKKLEGFYAVAPVPCASNSGGSFSVNTSNCKKPLKVNRPNLNTGFSDNFLQSAVNTVGDYTDALAAGNMARAEVLAGSLSNMAGRLKIERDNALKKYNQLAKQNKKKVIDFDKEVKAFTASMSGNLSKSLASQGIDPKSMMKASTGADKKPMAAVSPAATPVTGAPEVPVTDLAETAETPTEETAAAPTPTLEESLEQFESNESDISPEKQVSIFKQVSNRYILNLNRFFKEETPVAEAPVPSEPKDTPAEQQVTQPVK